jgi:hypothetical protein
LFAGPRKLNHCPLQLADEGVEVGKVQRLEKIVGRPFHLHLREQERDHGRLQSAFLGLRGGEVVRDFETAFVQFALDSSHFMPGVEDVFPKVAPTAKQWLNLVELAPRFLISAHATMMFQRSL